MDKQKTIFAIVAIVAAALSLAGPLAVMAWEDDTTPEPDEPNGNPHTQAPEAEPHGNPHQFPNCHGNPHSQISQGAGECNGAI